MFYYPSQKMSNRQVVEDLIREADEQIRRIEDLLGPFSLMGTLHQQWAELWRSPAQELVDELTDLEKIEDSSYLSHQPSRTGHASCTRSRPVR